MKKKNKLIVRFLGGVGEIGKNMTAIEYGKDIIVIDCGTTFPSADMPGIDLVIPDYSYLTANKDRVKAVFLTHGHEDHIGALPYFLKDINAPVYGTKLSLTLVETKLKEMKISGYKLKAVNPSSKINVGQFNVEFIKVNHSIPGACALAITTPLGTIVHSGDFKIDLTPINGELMDITRFSELGKKGVLLMLCESTNVDRQGYSMSETVVGSTLERLFVDNVKKRIVIATFSTNVHRIQQIISLAGKFKRKVALSGRSMINVTEAAQKINELKIPEGVLVDIEKIKNIPDKDLVVICTGSQGEPMSALTRMATDDYPLLKLTKNDTIIISANMIPGNERSIYQVINNLYKKGIEVLYQSLEQIHVSGHAYQEELKILHSLVKPKYFIPVHGEYRHLYKHVKLAKSLGMKDYETMICDIGDSVELTAKTMRKIDKIPAGMKFIDGLTIDDDQTVVRDRVHMAEDGLIVALCCVSAGSGKVYTTELVIKGFIITDEQKEQLIFIIDNTIKSFDLKAMGDKSEVRNHIRRAIRKFITKKTKNSPMILPVITEI